MLDVLVIGAGPCGLATAAALQRAGLDYLVVDKGCVTDAITRYPANMTFFSTSDRLAIAGVPFVTSRPNPTREEALEYYRQVADALNLSIRQYEEVTTVHRDAGAFQVRTRPVTRPGAGERLYRTRHLVVATGSFHRPNLLGIPGEDLPNVSHYFTEPHRMFRQRVVVVGGRNSAVEAVLALHRVGAEVTLVHRGDQLSDRVKPWLLPFIQKRLENGEITGCFRTHVVEIRPDTVVLESDGRRRELPSDFTFLLTGYLPDHALLKALGVEIDPESGAPSHDPASMQTNVPGLYIAGVVAAGYDANKIFIENGRFHGERIAAHLLQQQGLSRDEAQRRVAAALPAVAQSDRDGRIGI